MVVICEVNHSFPALMQLCLIIGDNVPQTRHQVADAVHGQGLANPIAQLTLAANLLKCHTKIHYRPNQGPSGCGIDPTYSQSLVDLPKDLNIVDNRTISANGMDATHRSFKGSTTKLFAGSPPLGNAHLALLMSSHTATPKLQSTCHSQAMDGL